MPNSTKQHYRKYLNSLLFLTGLTFATTWLPFLRGLMDGDSYFWGTSLFGRSFSGSGISGDFFYVLLNLIVGLLLLYSFYWMGKRIIFYSLLVVWYGSMIANTFYESFFGGGYFFNGDTLNVHLDLSYVILPLMLLMGILVIRVIQADRKLVLRSEWTRRNTIWALALLTPVIIQAYLFQEGEPHGVTDKIGVILALLQVLLVSIPLRAYKFRSE